MHCIVTSTIQAIEITSETDTTPYTPYPGTPNELPTQEVTYGSNDISACHIFMVLKVNAPSVDTETVVCQNITQHRVW